MSDCNIPGVRSIELGVTDLERSTRFYRDTWGLKQVVFEDGIRYLRAAGTEHHVVALREIGAVRMLGFTLAAADTATVDWVYALASKAGSALDKPGPLPRAAGGGYGFTLRGAENLRVTLACAVARWEAAEADHSRPVKLSHVVLNTGDATAHRRFFTDLLGFRTSDTTDRMEFMRCGTDHHAVALAYGDRLSLNHAAFELSTIDSLMYGVGRLLESGYDIGWGIGRHGPGNNVFAYFVDPDGFVVEYTTEMEQIDETRYQANDPAYWSKFPRRPCRWGIARTPSDRLMAAMGGKHQASPV